MNQLAASAHLFIGLFLIVLGVTGVFASVRYRDKVTKTPLTEAMWAASFAQLWLGLSISGFSPSDLWRLTTVAAGIALTQYRIWSVLKTLTPKEVAES